MRQCTRLIRFLKKGRVPQSSIAASFFFTYSPATFTINPSLSLSIKHAVIKCTTICQIGWKKHKWGSSIITSHKVTDNLVIHWRSTTVSRQTSMSDSNRLWFSLYVPFFFFLLLHLSIEKVNWKKFEKNFKRKDLVSNIFDDLPNYIYLRGFWKGNRRDESDIETATSNVIAIMGFFLKLLICN